MRRRTFAASSVDQIALRAAFTGLVSVTEGVHERTSCPAMRRSSISSSTTRFSPDVDPDRYRECKTRIRMG